MNKLFRLLFLILAIVSQSTNSQTPAKELIALNKHGVPFVQILGESFAPLAEEGAPPPGRQLGIPALAAGGN